MNFNAEDIYIEFTLSNFIITYPSFDVLYIFNRNSSHLISFFKELIKSNKNRHCDEAQTKGTVH